MRIVILDYGIGNVQSIFNVLAKFDGVDIILSDNHAEILNADGLILPGVGAYKKAMEELHKRDLPQILTKYIAKRKPLLGICLGMQLLFESSDEFGYTKGLGVIKGKVARIPHDGIEKLPHIGWNSVSRHSVDWRDTLFKDIEDKDDFYFVHSFFCEPVEEGIITSKTFYSGVDFCSSIQKDSIYGFQFHPEKSSISGIKLIKNFVDVVESS